MDASGRRHLLLALPGKQYLFWTLCSGEYTLELNGSAFTAEVTVVP